MDRVFTRREILAGLPMKSSWDWLVKAIGFSTQSAIWDWTQRSSAVCAIMWTFGTIGKRRLHWTKVMEAQRAYPVRNLKSKLLRTMAWSFRIQNPKEYKAAIATLKARAASASVMFYSDSAAPKKILYFGWSPPWHRIQIGKTMMYSVGMIQQVTGILLDSGGQHLSQEDIMFCKITTKHACISQTLNWTPQTFTYHLLVHFTVRMTFYLAFNLAFYLWYLLWHSIWHSLWHFFRHPDLTFLSDILSKFF